MSNSYANYAMGRLPGEIANARNSHEVALAALESRNILKQRIQERDAQVDRLNSTIRKLNDHSKSSAAQALAYKDLIHLMMSEIDRLEGDADKNRFRGIMMDRKIPAGPREGENPTVADELFLTFLDNHLKEGIKNDKYYKVKQLFHTVVGSIRECKIWG